MDANESVSSESANENVSSESDEDESPDPNLYSLTPKQALARQRDKISSLRREIRRHEAQLQEASEKANEAAQVNIALSQDNQTLQQKLANANQSLLEHQNTVKNVRYELKRLLGFGPEDVTWMELYAAIERLISSRGEIDRLAKFVTDEVPGEPSQSQGVVDTVIRLIRYNVLEPGNGDLHKDDGTDSFVNPTKAIMVDSDGASVEFLETPAERLLWSIAGQLIDKLDQGEGNQSNDTYILLTHIIDNLIEQVNVRG